MNNKLVTKSNVTAEDGVSGEYEANVIDAIESINALYASACKNAQAVRKLFVDCGMECRDGFYNNHAIAVGDGYINELYPIPIVTAKFKGVSVDIGFDIVSRNGNIGFSEFTVDKAVLVEIDFSKLSAFDFAIYGVENYHTDYWFGDITSTKELIAKSGEKQFHIGFEFPDMIVLKQILDIFFGVTSGVSFGSIDSDKKMLDKK